MNKSCKHGYRNFFRSYAKKFYKERKNSERQIGFKINELIQEIHYEIKEIKKGSFREDAQEFLKKMGQEVAELRATVRVKDEFPSFAKFWRYLKKEKINLKDLQKL